MRQIFLLYTTLSSAFFFSLTAKAQTDPPFLNYLNHPWVDSVFNTLSHDERIAQLIAVAAYSNRGVDHRRQILKMIREQKVGGLIFFQGGPGRQASQINEYQAASKVPLLISMDARSEEHTSELQSPCNIVCRL